MTDKFEAPAEWAPYLPMVISFARTVLAALGGVGFTWALTVNGDQMQMAVTAAMMVAAAGWSLYQKIRAQRALRQAAAAPAGSPPPQLPS